MILNAVLQWVAGALSWVLGALPSWSALGLPDVSSLGVQIADLRIWQYFAWANHYVPLDVGVALIVARLAVWAVMYGIEFLLWLGTKIHLFGGSS